SVSAVPVIGSRKKGNLSSTWKCRRAAVRRLSLGNITWDESTGGSLGNFLPSTEYVYLPMSAGTQSFQDLIGTRVPLRSVNVGSLLFSAAVLLASYKLTSVLRSLTGFGHRIVKS